jgi:hypothetical protein
MYSRGGSSPHPVKELRSRYYSGLTDSSKSDVSDALQSHQVVQRRELWRTYYPLRTP